MVLDVSLKLDNLAGNIKSMRFQSEVQTQCLEFSYYIDIVPQSTASVS